MKALRSLLLLPAILALLPATAWAGTATLSWTAPTTYTDNTPISGPITYTVYGAVQGGTKVLITSGVSALTYTHTAAVNGQTWCYAVSATVAGAESAQSTEACKLIPSKVPNPPTITTLAVVAGLNMTPLYRINVDGTRGTTVLGFVPTGTACTGPVVYTYRGNSYRTPDLSHAQWWGTAPTSSAAAACS